MRAAIDSSSAAWCGVARAVPSFRAGELGGRAPLDGFFRNDPHLVGRVKWVTCREGSSQECSRAGRLRDPIRLKALVAPCNPS